MRNRPIDGMLFGIECLFVLDAFVNIQSRNHAGAKIQWRTFKVIVLLSLIFIL